MSEVKKAQIKLNMAKAKEQHKTSLKSMTDRLKRAGSKPVVELNKYTLAQYQNKAAGDLAMKAMDQGSGLKDRSTDANKRKIQKRMVGIGKAARKLSGGGYTGGVGPESPTGKMHNEANHLANISTSSDYDGDRKPGPTVQRALDANKGKSKATITKGIYKRLSKDRGVEYPRRKTNEENIDEVSKKTLGSYVDKAAGNLMKRAHITGMRDGSGRDPIGSVATAKRDKEVRDVVNRRAGIKGAARRLSKEEVDQVDELNVRTMRSYKDKAAGDIEDRVAAGHTTPTDKTKKRMQGIGRASDKIQTAKIKQRQRMGVNELKTSTLKSYLSKVKDKHSDMLNPHVDDYEPHKVDQERNSGLVYKGDEIARAKAKLAKRGVNELKTPTLKRYLSKADDSVTDMAQDGKSATSKFNKRRLGMAKAQGRLSMNRQLGRAEESVQEDKDLEKVVKNLQAAIQDVKKHIDVMNEDGHTDVASARRKAVLILEDASQLYMKLKTMPEEAGLPSWWMNKMAVTAAYMDSMRNYLLVPSVDNPNMGTMPESYSMASSDTNSADKFRKKVIPQQVTEKKKKKKIKLVPMGPTSFGTGSYTDSGGGDASVGENVNSIISKYT